MEQAAVDFAFIAALSIVIVFTVLVFLLVILPRLVLWMQSRACELERLEHTEEIVEAVRSSVAAQFRPQLDAALAMQRAAHHEEMSALRRAIAAEYGEMAAQVSRKLNAALREQRAALQQDMDATKGSICETITRLREKVRDLKAGMREMRRGLHTPDERVRGPGSEQPDERVLGPGSEQRPADHPGALVGRFYEEAGSAVRKRSDSEPLLCARADPPPPVLRASFSAPAPPVAAAPAAPGARGQPAQEPQRRHALRRSDQRH